MVIEVEVRRISDVLILVQSSALGWYVGTYSGAHFERASTNDSIPRVVIKARYERQSHSAWLHDLGCWFTFAFSGNLCYLDLCSGKIRL
jgi:hypothetical protein